MQSKTILITGARAPVALHLARLLGDAGHRVILADSLRHSLSFASTLASAKELLPRPNDDLNRYKAALTTLIERYGVTDVIPTCEEVFHLAKLWAEGDFTSRLHAPDIELLTAVHNKHTFNLLAKSYGLAVPKTTLLQSVEDLDKIRSNLSNLVLKPVWSRFATRVLIRPSAKDVRMTPSLAEPWVAQTALDGVEICSYALAKQGKLTALSMYRCDYRADKGAGIFFVPIEDDNIRHFVQHFVSSSMWDGQISFDFMRLADGRIMPLECNPRATSGVHFFGNGMNFANALLNGAPTSPDILTPQTLPMAMWVYGAPKALMTGQWHTFWADIQRGGNILHWPTDRSADWQQWRALAEITWIALRRRQSLQTASTADIEWNGDHNSI